MHDGKKILYGPRRARTPSALGIETTLVSALSLSFLVRCQVPAGSVATLYTYTGLTHLMIVDASDKMYNFSTLTSSPSSVELTEEVQAADGDVEGGGEFLVLVWYQERRRCNGRCPHATHAERPPQLAQVEFGADDHGDILVRRGENSRRGGIRRFDIRLCGREAELARRCGARPVALPPRRRVAPIVLLRVLFLLVHLGEAAAPVASGSAHCNLDGPLSCRERRPTPHPARAALGQEAAAAEQREHHTSSDGDGEHTCFRHDGLLLAGQQLHEPLVWGAVDSDAEVQRR